MKVAVVQAAALLARAVADALHAPDPAVRRAAARELNRRGQRNLMRRVEGWPADSPGVANAWLVLVTTKAPQWRDPFLLWTDEPPAFGTPPAGFFYPDPQGFWQEVRRWVTALVRSAEPGAGTPDALSVSALFHLGDDPGRTAWAIRALDPAVVVFLDEAAWGAAEMDINATPYAIPDPYRAGVTYDGFWGHTPAGLVVGKSPQHPAAHQLYRAQDMDGFLRAIPNVRG